MNLVFLSFILLNYIIHSYSLKTISFKKPKSSLIYLLKTNEELSKEEVKYKGVSPTIQNINKVSVELVKGLLFLYYGDRHYARFAALETIARVPYFSYTSVLHLFETCGWFRKKEYIKMHFAESWNELHHLLIMESLGGTDRFGDRFVAQHIGM